MSDSPISPQNAPWQDNSPADGNAPSGAVPAVGGSWLQRNRQTAMDRLVRLLRLAAVRPRKRIATRPTRASVARRRQTKERRSRAKRLRSERPAFD